LSPGFIRLALSVLKSEPPESNLVEPKPAADAEFIL